MCPHLLLSVNNVFENATKICVKQVTASQMCFCICVKLNLWIALDRLTGTQYYIGQNRGMKSGGEERAAGVNGPIERY